MKNKYIILILAILFIVIIIKYIFTLYSAASSCDGWIVGDWLINYQEGFVRRGLSGSIMIGLSNLLGIKANFIVMWFQIIIFTAYMLIIFLLFYCKKINMWFVLLLLSPVTLFFPILSFPAAGRKEIILFFLFSFFVFLLQKKLLKSYISVVLFSLLLLVATLCHELIVFYLPYFLFAIFLKSRIDKESFPFIKSLIVISGSVLIMIPIYLYGYQINTTSICAGLKEIGLSDNVCSGILSIPSYGLEDVVKTIKNFNYFFNYSIALALGLIPFILFVYYSRSKVLTVKILTAIFMLLFIFSLPIFIFATDWGRWLNIHFLLLLITLTLLLKDNDNVRKKWLNENVVIPKIWKTNIVLLNYVNDVVFVLIFIAYITLWSMQHWGPFPIFSLNFYNVVF